MSNALLSAASLAVFAGASILAALLLSKRRHHEASMSSSTPLRDFLRLVSLEEENEAAKLVVSQPADEAMCRRVLQEARGGWAQLDRARFTLVEDDSTLKEAARRLSKAAAIGVDVEHSPRSFHGFVCTLQISTADEDFLIDCLRPEVRRALKPLLSPIFASPSILKVMHSAGNDIRWLSSNYAIRVAALLDTAVLARMSRDADDRHHSSLAGLLVSRLGVTTDKRFQTSDWRLRPLPKDMIAYGRTDSRYLLPLAAVLLLEGECGLGNFSLADVLRRSADVAQLKYDGRKDREVFPLSSLREWARKQDWSRSSATRDVPDLFVRLAEIRHSFALHHDFNPDDLIEKRQLLELATGLLPAETFSSLAVDWPPGMHEEMMLAASTPRQERESASPRTASEERERLKAGRSQKLLVPRASPLYHNISLVSPSGVLLARVDRKKASWYCQSGLVDVIDEDGSVILDLGLPAPTLEDADLPQQDDPIAPMGAALIAKRRHLSCNGNGKNGAGCIHRTAQHSGIASAGASLASLSKNDRLERLFDQHLQKQIAGSGSSAPLVLRMRREPRGLGHDGDAFHLREKTNECGVCGIGWEKAKEAGGMTRLYVVPHVFREQFPLSAKSYNCHDIFVVCVGCSRKAALGTAAITKALLSEFGLPSSLKEAHAQGLTTTPAPTADGGADSLSLVEHGLYCGIVAIKKDVGLVLRDRQGGVSGKDGGEAARRSRERIEEVAWFIKGFASQIAAAEGRGDGGGEEGDGLATLLAFRMQGKQRRCLTALARFIMGESDGDSAHLPAVFGCASELETRERLKSLFSQAPPLVAGLAGGPRYEPATIIVRATLEGSARWKQAEAFGRFPNLTTSSMLPIPRLSSVPASPNGEAALREAREWICSRAALAPSDHRSDDELAALCASFPLPPGLASRIPGLASGLPLAAEYRLSRLVFRWRRDFVDIVRPAALPSGWNVAYRCFQAGLRSDGTKETTMTEELLKTMWATS